MAVFLIDGDNAPGTRTKGLNCLSSKDMVCICYTKTNKYYQNAEMVKKLRESTAATIHFYSTENNRQAADFFLAIKAEAYIQRGEKEVYLISGDNHITTITAILQKQHNNIKISRAGNIYEGYLNDLNRVTDLNAAKNVIVHFLDEEKGNLFYDRLEKLFLNEFVSSKKGNLLAKLTEKLKRRRR